MALSIALAQVNPTVGDLEGNSALIKNFTKKAAELGASLVVFPEMVLTGYPIEDLSLRKSFQEASKSALNKLALDLKNQELGNLHVIVGYLDSTGESNKLGVPAGSPENAAAIIHDGKIVKKYVKHHLPNYGVFDEYRYFVPGEESCSFEVAGNKISLAICEDIWQDGGPIAEISKLNTDLLLVINGSPFEHGKDDVRLDLLKKRVSQINAPIAYVNMVGGQDELVFDGDSIVINKNGEIANRASQFVEELVLFEFEKDKPIISGNIRNRNDDLEEVYQALVVGLRDYIYKNNLESVILGLSGGIDSALVAAIAVDAIGAKNVYGVSMPSKYSSEHSIEDAKELAIFARKVPTKINLIEYNSIGDSIFTNTSEDKLNKFFQYLAKEGHIVNLRRSRGKDIDAACGQLANKSAIK